MDSCIRDDNLTRLPQIASRHIEHCAFQAIALSNQTVIPYAMPSSLTEGQKGFDKSSTFNSIFRIKLERFDSGIPVSGSE